MFKTENLKKLAAKKIRNLHFFRIDLLLTKKNPLPKKGAKL